MAKETLGYAARTDAVLALRKRGFTTREIALRIGIEPKTVVALECSASRRKDRGTCQRTSPAIGAIPLATISRLRPHAAKRFISVDRLMREIIDAVADGDLVDAVLDDLEGHHG
jgi:hypothetical protein